MTSMSFISKSAIAACAVLLCASVGFAAETAAKPAMPTMTKESREAMAKAHEKAAACLRSDRDLSECHKEMMANGGQMMEGMNCQMMKSDGMKGGTMKKQHHDSAPPAKP